MVVSIHSQSDRDKARRTYTVNFPNDLSTESIIAWVRQIGGKLQTSMPLDVPSIVFETWATRDGITHRLKVPAYDAEVEYVVGQLHGLIPGIRLTPEEEFPKRVWVRAAEFGLTNSDRQLDMPVASNVARSLLTVMQPLKDNETIVVQWVIAPMRRRTPPHYEADEKLSRDEVNDVRGKLEHPNVKAVMRIGTVANTRAHAADMLHNVMSAMRGSSSAAVRFRQRFVTPAGLQHRIESATTPVIFPMQLSAPEVAPLLAWPPDGAFINGLPPFLSRQLPPSQAILREGLVVGHSTFHGSERRIAIGYDDALMHSLVLGEIGTGKTVLLDHMATQIIEKGYGLMMMETEGNLYQFILDHVPENRIKDVALIDFEDRNFPVGFNVLDQGNRLNAIDHLMDLFEHKYGNGLWASVGLYNGLRTLVETPGTSFTDIAALLSPRTHEEEDWVDRITRELKDTELRRWWQNTDNRGRDKQQQRADPVVDRISKLTSRPELRHVFGQGTSTIDMARMLREDKIVLVNLKGVSRETASMAGTLLMEAALEAIKGIWKTDKPYFIMLDEFAEFTDLPMNMQSMLQHSRKHGFGLILATQYLGQLKKHDMGEAVVSHTRNKVILKCNADDARLVCREWGIALKPEDLTNLQAFEAMAQIQTPTGIAPPVSIRTYAPIVQPSYAKRIIAHSRETYGRPVKEVQAEMENRHLRPEGAKGRRPKISGSASPEQSPA